MSEGNDRCDRIMAPLMMKLPSGLYNRVYEAVDALPDGMAQRLVDQLCIFVGSTGPYISRDAFAAMAEPEPVAGEAEHVCHEEDFVAASDDVCPGCEAERHARDQR